MKFGQNSMGKLNVDQLMHAFGLVEKAMQCMQRTVYVIFSGVYFVYVQPCHCSCIYHGADARVPISGVQLCVRALNA